MDRRNGKVDNANTHLTLKGYTDAKFVYVRESSVVNFMSRTEDGWEGEFDLPEGVQYSFVVDGNQVVKP